MTQAQAKRRPGRPPSYVFDKPDAELTELERRLKLAVVKRRLRQNRSYHRRKAATARARSRDDETLGGRRGDELPEGHRAAEAVEGWQGGGETIGGQRGGGAMPEGASRWDTLPIAGSALVAARPAHAEADADADAQAEDEDEDEAEDDADADADAEAEAEADALLAELASAEALASSAALLRLSGAAVASRLAQLPAAAQVGARVLSFFPEGFDACAAAALLGRNVGALVPLIQANVLVVSDSSGGGGGGGGGAAAAAGGGGSGCAVDATAAPRFRVNPLVKYMLPAVRAAPLLPGGGVVESANPATDLMATVLEATGGGGDGVGDGFDEGEENENEDEVSDEVLRTRFVAHFGGLLASLSDNPRINRDGGERLRAMRAFDADRRNLLHGVRLSAELGARVHVDYLRKGASIMRYCTDAKSRVAFFQAALAAAAPVFRAGGGGGRGSGGGVSWVEDVFAGGSTSSMHAAAPAAAATAAAAGSGSAVDSPATLERSNLAWLLEFGHGFCPELAAKAVEDAQRTVAAADEEARVWRNHARIQLALGEAYIDMLDLERAEGPLERARELLDGRSGGNGWAGDSYVEAVSLALPNLLLAEIRASKGQLAEAKRLLYHALGILSQAGLSESTFTVNAMNTLVGVHLSAGSCDEAMWTCTRLVDVLANMGGGSYRGMPIFADALGTLATVYLHVQQPAEAERLFCEALEVAESWLGRAGWHEDAPFEHCQDLDIWLMEGLARSLRDQGKVTQAQDRLAEASARRHRRGLSAADDEPYHLAGAASHHPLADSLGVNFTDVGLFPGGDPSLVDMSIGGSSGGAPDGSSFSSGIFRDSVAIDAFFSTSGGMEFKASLPRQGLLRTRPFIDTDRPYPRHIY